MKKFLSLLCVLALICNVANAKEYKFKETKDCPQNKELKCDLQDNLVTGKVVVDSKNGSAAQEFNYKDGKRDGVQTYFHRNGTLSLKMNYKDNKLDGVTTNYYESGKVQLETTYKNGVVLSMKGFYEDGKLESESTTQNGVKNTKSYYKSGKLKSEGVTQNGVTNIKEYYEDGKLKSESSVKGNITKVKDYYENGKVKMEGSRKDGIPSGLFNFYNKDGKLIAEVTFEKVILSTKKVIEKDDIVMYDFIIKDGEFTAYSYENDTVKKMTKKEVKKLLESYQ